MTARAVAPAEAQEMLKHTLSGPWAFTYGHPEEYGPCYSIHNAEWPVALVIDDQGSEEEPDARLIAAAPDLAATVASEPARIAAAVAAERAAIVAQIKASEEKYRDALRKCRDHFERAAYMEGANALGAIAHEIAGRTP